LSSLEKKRVSMLQNPPSPDQLSFILPALNEAGSLQNLIPKLKEFYPTSEILVINDGSSDNTGEVAERCGARVISHPYRKGNGAAIKTGIRHATRPYLVFMDADGQHRPEDVAEVIDSLGRYELVIGARIEDRTSPLHRKVANSIYNLFASYLTQIHIQDLTSGFRALPRKLALQFCYLFPNTYSYPSTLPLSMVRAGYSIHFVPITVLRRQGKSKINLLRDGIGFLLIMMKVIMLFAPLRVFLPVSLVSFMLGIVWGGYNLWVYSHFTPATLLLMVTALLTFLMGLIGEQIAQLRLSRIDEDHHPME
jgi:glycosyltransferase involved in cell wall biosynthesis